MEFEIITALVLICQYKVTDIWNASTTIKWILFDSVILFFLSCCVLNYTYVA